MLKSSHLGLESGEDLFDRDGAFEWRERDDIALSVGVDAISAGHLHGMVIRVHYPELFSAG